jgi:alpha-L-fucosidase
VTRYKPSIIFTDGEWEHTAAEWRTPELLAWLYNDGGCGEDLAVNDRWGSDTRGKHGGYYTTEYGGFTDFKAGPGHAWEESRGMGASYGYNRNESIDDYRTTAALVRVLVETVSQGGNLLLDIGPTADGRIPVIMQERLAGMGNWLKVNGDAIYGTTFAPFAPPPWGRMTRKGNKLYAVVFDWPKRGQPLRVPVAGRVKSARLLQGGEPVKCQTIGQEGVDLHLPANPPDRLAPVIVLELERN